MSSDAVKRLTAAGVDNPRLDARLLLAHAKNDPMLFESFVARRAAREPLAYITGHKEFWSLDFEVGPGVLIPRPETETVIECVLAAFPDRTAPLQLLDLGTGSGCLLITLLKEYPKARGLGLEKSEKTRRFALRNVARHAMARRCEIREGGWPGLPEGAYDVVLSNPPYIRSHEICGLAPEVCRYEPVMALDGGEDGLTAYRALAPEITRLLRPGGYAFLEIGVGQDKTVPALFAAAGMEPVALTPDLAGNPRVLTAKPKE